MPLLERVKFLAIYTTNLDEFFMVRVAGLHDQVDAGIDARGPDGLTPARDDRRDRRAACRVSTSAARAQSSGASSARRSPSTASASSTCEDVQRRGAAERRPALRASRSSRCSRRWPSGPGRPFPYISNLSLSLAVWLRDPVTRSETFARVKVPKEVLPRFVPIGESTFVPLEHVIARHLDELFPGMEILRHSIFRVTRDADFTVSDEADDLLRAVEDELRRRRFGEVVRLEVGSDMDPELRERLVDWLDVEERQVYDVDGLLDLGDLWEIHGVDGHSELRDPPWTPVQHPAFMRRGARRGGHVRRDPRRRRARAPPVPLVRRQRGALRAAGGEDPDVLAIKITVYRTSDDSRARAGADRGRRARQAGGVPGGAEGPLRRAPQHRLGARAGGGGRARGARPARA